MPDYSLQDLDVRAKKALAALSLYVTDHDEHYRYVRDLRARMRVPQIALLGMSRAGKDTAALFLAQFFVFPKPQSSSLTVLPLIAHMAQGDREDVYKYRHENREFWLQACHALRADDPTRLARWSLCDSPFSIGLRGKKEFDAVRNEGIIDLSVWIDNSRVAVDPTVEFTRDDCDVVIDNHTSLDKFYDRLTRFGKLVYFGKK